MNKESWCFRRFALWSIFLLSTLLFGLVFDQHESVHADFPAVTLAFRRNEPEGTGHLFFTTKRVIWLEDQEGSEESERKVFDFDIPFITLHAISKDPSNW